MEHTNTTTQILTLEEARRRLPRVRPHVIALMEISTEVIDVNNTLQDLAHRDGDHAAERAALMARAKLLTHRYEVELKALNELGATLKDPSIGLIDFYGWHEDDIVFLCWKHGEDTIRYWHKVGAGFRGRRPVET